MLITPAPMLDIRTSEEAERKYQGAAKRKKIPPIPERNARALGLGRSFSIKSLSPRNPRAFAECPTKAKINHTIYENLESRK